LAEECVITIRTKVNEKYTISSSFRERRTAIDPVSSWHTTVWENRKDVVGKLRPKFIYAETLESGDANLVVRKHKELRKKILHGVLEGLK